MIREEKQRTLLASKVVEAEIAELANLVEIAYPSPAAVACLIMIRNYSLNLTVSLRIYAAAFSGRPDMIETGMTRLHCPWISVCP